jgi:nucleotide-binding universal stress UspA family protein
VYQATVSASRTCRPSWFMRDNTEADKELLHGPATKRLLPAVQPSIDKIVVAVDLSPHSEETARYAVALAKRFRAILNLVHVVPAQSVSESVSEEDCKVANETLSRLAETVRRIYPDCEAVCLLGEPAERVAWLAHVLNADLIVTGSHHPSALRRFFHLDQTHKVLNRALCPVLVYHEKCQSTPI